MTPYNTTPAVPVRNAETTKKCVHQTVAQLNGRLKERIRRLQMATIYRKCCCCGRVVEESEIEYTGGLFLPAYGKHTEEYLFHCKKCAQHFRNIDKTKYENESRER